MAHSPARTSISFIGNAYEHAYDQEQAQTQKNRQNNRQLDRIMWDRPELDLLLSLYGRHVAQGKWRDYGIDALKNMAVFSVFKRAHDQPLYRIEKNPSLRKKQGMYAVVNRHGHVLKRGHELRQLLKLFEKKKDSGFSLYRAP